MKVFFHLGVHFAGGAVLRHNVNRNRGRLRGRGVFYANADFPDVLRQQMWRLRATRNEAGGPGRSQMRAANTALMEAAQNARCRSVLLSHDDRLGYPPISAKGTANAALPFYPYAETLVSYWLAGLDPKDVTFLITTRAMEHLIPAQHQDALRGLAMPWDVDGYIDRVSSEAFRFEDLEARVREAAPEATLLARPYDHTNPEPFVDGFFRDLGVEPAGLRLEMQPAEPALLDREQGAALQALGKSLQRGEIEVSEARSQAEGVLSRVPDPARSLLPSRDRVARLAARSQRDQSGQPETGPLQVAFMVEPGPLELQAHLLMASLDLNGRDRMEITGFCRDDRMSSLHPETVGFLESCGARVAPITNTFPDGYPAGNKLFASAALNPARWGVFLDTDMLLMRPSRFLDEAVPGRLGVCLDTVNGWSQDKAQWAALHKAVGLDGPIHELALRSGQVSMPIYNAGMVMFPPARKGEAGPAQQWLNLALQIEECEEVINKRPWLDTLALAVLVRDARGPRLRPVDVAWNCTTRMADDTTRVLHYHGLRQIHGFGWLDRVNDMLARSPSPYNTLNEAMHHHRHELKVEGDLARRAMRHGLQTS